ncbi:MAG: DUF6438 domain-containing protein, partial [Bacteroidota bacterium]
LHYMKYLLLVLLASILVLLACKSTKNKQSANSSTPTPSDALLLEMKKGICFGRCPVYDLKVYADGRLQYDGKRFTDKIGLHERQLSEQDFSALRQMLSELDPSQYPEEFGNEIPDLPTTVLTFHENSPPNSESGLESKTIRWKQNKYEKLEALTTALEDLAKAEDWEKMETPTGKVDRQLIVQLKPDVKVEDWIQRYGRLELEVVKQIAPNQPLWLIGFNPNAATSGQLLQWLGEDPAVEKVELNKKMELRN